MVNDNTREYSVYISNEANTVQGSGVLFYAGGDSMFVFTCAHVVENLDKIRLFILKEIDASRDRYNVLYTEVSAAQVIYSPLDEIQNNEFGEKLHTEDIAVIQIKKPEAIELSTTQYYITETYRSHSVFVQGYPNGVPSGKKQIEYLDCLHGKVVVNSADSTRFTIRMDDNFIDAGSRVCELEGLSGAPVWDDNADVNGLLGVFTSAYGATALLSKTYVTKAQQLRAIMKERFGVLIERKLEGIPEEDVAGVDLQPITFDGCIEPVGKSEGEKWIDEQLSGLRCIIEDLKLQKAIDKGNELIQDSRYSNLSIESRRKIKQYLLYCYEIADMDNEFEQLETQMRVEGLIKGHDVLRELTRTFMRKQFHETIEAAQHYIDESDEPKNQNLLSFAKAFQLLAMAYTEDLAVEDTIGKLLDENERFIYPTDEIEDEALVYQMIGYVYGEHYHDYVNSVRFINRSYRVGYDSIVLESLGAAYYGLAIHDAIEADGRVSDTSRIDKKSLYKARECYLIVKSKADDLFWAGTMRRVGLCIYNTFVFLQDNYRILTVYPDVKKYLPQLNNNECRDIEMKYAMISAQKGEINVKEFTHITAKDEIVLKSIARASKCSNLIEDATANIPADQIGNVQQLARQIRDTTRYLERYVRLIDRKERIQIYVQMINLYGRGMLIFGWDKKEKLETLYERLSEYANPELLESISNFIFEMDAPIAEAEKRFLTSFESKKNIITWQELNHFYIRHGMFERADAMYQELFSERMELIEEGPEYAYRAFIDYVTLYKRNLKYALQCYLDAKETFKDTDIEGFWELELMLYSGTFNNPERFELERKQFVDKGLVTEESYHRDAFIAHLANLNNIEAIEHNNYIRQCPHLVNPQTGLLMVSKEEMQFLNWIGAVKPGFLPPSDSMVEERAKEVQNSYACETWHRKIDVQLKNQFGLNRKIAIDAWGLYQMAENDMLDVLDEFECVYVSHMSVIRLLEELSRTDNVRIRILLEYLKICNKVKIYSAGFKVQIVIRNVTQYFEPESTVAVAVEKDCLMLYGEPIVDKELIEHFGNRIVRINDINKLIEKSQ